MLERPNYCGGATLILAEGDDLDDVPDSHRDLVTAAIRNAFVDPASHFRQVADRTSLRNLRDYLAALVDQGKWSLLLAETFMMKRETIAGFQWHHPSMHSCMFAPATTFPVNTLFETFYNDVALAHWGAVGNSGGIFPACEHIPLSLYGVPSTNPVFPVGSSTIFATSPCGDMMIYNTQGDAGYLSHETGMSYVMGSVPEMLDWVFGQLMQGRLPEFDYSRC
ncbi:MAG: hypothetical protein MUC83_07200 [Pirellula sp.]|jgi:hypothetical protein|nr:hypothetical protein [Pirellula sp.]